MDTFPVLKTERLLLRKPKVADIPHIVEYANHPEIAEMTLNIPHPYDEEDAVYWLNMSYQGFKKKSKYIFAVCRLPTEEFIGGMGLELNRRFNRAELGYWIAEPFWNNGFATEAAREVLRFGFDEVGINKIFAIHLLDNPASQKVLVKNGMKKEGKLTDHIKKDDKYLSVGQYRLTQDEFRNQ